jgi:hypothetical protein
MTDQHIGGGPRGLKEGHFAWQGRKECGVAVAERTWRCWVEAEKALQIMESLSQRARQELNTLVTSWRKPLDVMDRAALFLCVQLGMEYTTGIKLG